MGRFFQPFFFLVHLVAALIMAILFGAHSAGAIYHFRKWRH